MAGRIDNSKEFLVEISQDSDLEANSILNVNIFEADDSVIDIIDEIDAIQNAMQDAINNDETPIEEIETAAGDAGNGVTLSNVDFSRDAQETLATSIFATEGVDFVPATVDFTEVTVDLALTPGDIIPLTDDTATGEVLTNEAPTLSITSSGNHLSSAGVAMITFTFSEATLTFDDSDISVVGGSLGMVSSEDGGLTYTALFIQSGTDAPSISVGDTVYSDTDGNTGTGDELLLNLAPIAIDDDISSDFTATIGSPDGESNVWENQNQSPTNERFTYVTEIGNKITISGSRDGVAADIGYINSGINHHDGTGIGINGQINPSNELNVDFGGTVSGATEIGLGGLGGHFTSSGNNPKNAKVLWTAYDSEGIVVASGEVQEDVSNSDGDGNTETVSFTVGAAFNSIIFAATSDRTGSNYTLQYVNAVYEVSVIGTPEDTPLTIAASSLLANDNDLDATDSSLIISRVVASADTHGSVQLTENGDVIFTPEENYHGAASFIYTVMDAEGGTDTAVAFLTVAPVNDAPVITVFDTLVIDPDSDELVIATANDIDGNIAAVSSDVGRVEIDSDGNVIYTSERDGEIETVVLTVTDDAGLSTTKHIDIESSEATQVVAGTNGNDLLIADEGVDTFIWSEGDMGTDNIENFNLNEGDRLDLSDLLNLENDDDLNTFIDFTSASGDTTISIYADGNDAALTQTIVLDEVDLGSDDVVILNELLFGAHEGSLLIGDNWRVDDLLTVTNSDELI